MTLLQWSLLWLTIFIIHAQFTLAVVTARRQLWNKWSTVAFTTALSFFILSLFGANGVY